MRSKNFFDTVVNAIGVFFTIAYGMPIIIIIIVIMVAYQGVYRLNIQKEYENADNIIFSSKLESTVFDMASKVYDTNSFSSINKYDTDSYSVEIEYVFKEANKSAEYYDSLVKDEVTKLYNKLDGNIIKNDGIFGYDSKESIALCFRYPMSEKTNSYLCTAVLMYFPEKGFDKETYQNEINSTIVTKEKLNYAKEHWY